MTDAIRGLRQKEVSRNMAAEVGVTKHRTRKAKRSMHLCIHQKDKDHSTSEFPEAISLANCNTENLNKLGSIHL